MSSDEEERETWFKRDLTFLILQCLDEEKYSETRHKLECESRCYFDVRYVKDLVLGGNFDEAERYFSSFAKMEDDDYSTLVFFKLRKQKYYEALDRRDLASATAILVNELKVFAQFHEELCKEMAWLLTFHNIREHRKLVGYTNAEYARAKLATELEELFNHCTSTRDKLQFPQLADSRLRTLINQSLFWQHRYCKNRGRFPQLKSFFADHRCVQPDHLDASPGSSS